MNDLPSEVVDLSGLFSQIQTDCEAIALMQLNARLSAYTEAVSTRDGNKYQKWQHLPVKALNSLAEKLRKELAAMPPEKGKAIAPQIQDSKLNDDFF